MTLGTTVENLTKNKTKEASTSSWDGTFHAQIQYHNIKFDILNNFPFPQMANMHGISLFVLFFCFFTANLMHALTIAVIIFGETSNITLHTVEYKMQNR